MIVKLANPEYIDLTIYMYTVMFFYPVQYYLTNKNDEINIFVLKGVDHIPVLCSKWNLSHDMYW